METRKVYMSGGSTYVMSLPKKWVKRTNLRAGDALMVAEQGDSSLLVGTAIAERTPTVRDIRISRIETSDAMERIIIAFYLGGYDTISIKLDRKDHLPYRESVRKVLDRLIGVQIVEDTNDSMTLEIVVDYKRMMTPQIIRRVFSIDRDMLLDLGKVLNDGEIGLAKDIMVRELETDRLCFLAVRQLKSAVRYPQVMEKLGILHQRDCLGYRIVIKFLERIADHIKNAAKSYVQLSEMGRQPQPDRLVELTGKTAATFEKSVLSLLARNGEMAEAVFRELGEIERSHSGISRESPAPKNVQHAILQKTILDSLERIAGYSGDIAEIAINMSVEEP